MNCYLAFGSPCNLNEEYERLVNALDLTLHKDKGQRIILTLDNYWNSSNGNQESIQTRLIERVHFQESLAKKYNAAAYISFLYQSQPSSVDYLMGLSEMPLVKKYIFDLGQSVTHKSDILPATVDCTQTTVSCENSDYVRRNSCAEIVDVWRNAPPCIPLPMNCTINPEAFCEGPHFVRRNSCNEIVEVWAKAPLCPQ